MTDAADETTPFADEPAPFDDPLQVRERASLIEPPPCQTRDTDQDAWEADVKDDPLLALLAQPPDVIIDQLCEGKPRDFQAECESHIELNAYFIERGRVAARVIAMLATLSYAGQTGDREVRASLKERLDSLIPEATAEILDEGPLHRSLELDALGGDDAPEERGACELVESIGRVLGLDAALAHRLIATLNDLGFDDRHVFFHCILRKMTPEAYGDRFQEDPRVVSVMLRKLAKLAVDGPLE